MNLWTKPPIPPVSVRQSPQTDVLETVGFEAFEVWALFNDTMLSPIFHMARHKKMSRKNALKLAVYKKTIEFEALHARYLDYVITNPAPIRVPIIETLGKISP